MLSRESVIVKRFYYEYRRTSVGHGRVTTEEIRSSRSEIPHYSSSPPPPPPTSWVPIIQTLLSDPEVVHLLKQGAKWLFSNTHILWYGEHSKYKSLPPSSSIIHLPIHKTDRDKALDCLGLSSHPDPSPYQILGLANHATPKQIKDRYHVLCKAWHPDRKPPCTLVFDLITKARNECISKTHHHQ